INTALVVTLHRTPFQGMLARLWSHPNGITPMVMQPSFTHNNNTVIKEHFNLTRDVTPSYEETPTAPIFHQATATIGLCATRAGGKYNIIVSDRGSPLRRGSSQYNNTLIRRN
ncbi:MAG: hypothetical protein PHR10_10555, partial [Sphaerochaetaceae bacterium]|nr:hypothetical protein [Sphaerochaetaceae bacterium]